MQILSRLLSRRSPATVEVVAPVLPDVVIAEPFHAFIHRLNAITVPGDLRAIRTGRALQAIVMDEAGAQVRVGQITQSAPGVDRIAFPEFPDGTGPAFWLFVVETLGEADPAPLVPALRALAAGLGQRPLLAVGCEGPRLDRAQLSFAMISDEPPAATLPPLDQPVVDGSTLSPEQRQWREEGVAILKGFLSDDLLDPYIARREQVGRPGGWRSPTPYMHVEELRRICLHPPLMRVLNSLVGEEMLLHLNLTGWVSTERDWHQDEYLSPPFVNSWYAAVWIALDRIHPDAGPFEYIPGSHRWPLLRGARVRQFMTDEERRLAAVTDSGYDAWPSVTQAYVAPIVEAEIARRGVEKRAFLAEKGDVLVWHGRLMHRGSPARQPGLERRSLIAHYTGVNHRPDMPDRRVEGSGQYAVFHTPLI
ncbi:phytanoyl-CoA dioxygenase family protein [Nitrospirillum amazonense]|uniref:Phytanoyl-CoA dioxygenase PhyH n=1 Tax=Nitrospirillum amazonense TaxID=28077 RepID=A0A560KQY9_9PROT|nr:phytanoyl-CoA dioxygenase family protein [Nitrospirillum amazonense]MDG3444357.1 phytanoyl-CoA dioxygenase family protein [Nitrospirillum amazonense]TWB83040.1 phytanoyl-CoA dioxygenase PhyH [Nitrospirillum amazonense]